MHQLSDTIKLLRFPFSVFLLPISLFSFYYIKPEFNWQLVLLLIIWHVLVFPSSNGYNSYNDQDKGPIGGLASPPQPTRLLLYVASIFDISALALSLLINIYFAVFVFVYITASRFYSNRKVRLKKYPVLGFLIVFIFQGAWIFYANIFALSGNIIFSDKSISFSALACSFFIGTIYPLTQIYQHDADEKDGVKTMSMLLGRKGTFIFSAFMFSIATLLIYLSFNNPVSHFNFWLFNIIMFPSTLYFLIWMKKSFQNDIHVNFRNTMTMLVLSSFLNNLYFLLLLIK